jgi:thioredoxin
MTFGFLSLMLFACGNGRNSKQVTDAKESVSQNSKDSPAMLNQDMFIQSIWDYKSSPKEWKYKGTLPAIIDFYADWCGPCKLAAPILDEIAKEYAGKIQVYKINTDKERELAQVFGIKGIPAFLYIPVSGRPTMTSGIGQSKEETRKMFIDNMAQYLQVKK